MSERRPPPTPPPPNKKKRGEKGKKKKECMEEGKKKEKEMTKRDRDKFGGRLRGLPHKENGKKQVPREQGHGGGHPPDTWVSPFGLPRLSPEARSRPLILGVFLWGWVASTFKQDRKKKKKRKKCGKKRQGPIRGETPGPSPNK